MKLKRLLVAGLAGMIPACGLGAEASLQEQLDAMPAEFRRGLLGLPLATSLWVDGQALGELLLQLDEQGRVSAVQWLGNAPGQDATRAEPWLRHLATPRRPGRCAADCPEGLLTMEYSLADGRLSLLTQQAERRDGDGYLSLATVNGALLRNELNVSHSGAGHSAGRYALKLRGSVGQWGLYAGTQLARTLNAGERTRQDLGEVYAQRELPGHFVRAGYFLPAEDGVVRPSSSGRSRELLGAMWGNSRALEADEDFPSRYPIYVNAARDSLVEVYRDGRLLSSQAVAGGLQALDTRTLPSGNYPVELRIVQDGVEQERRREWVYKPRNWGNPQQSWRYNLFGGRLAHEEDARDGAWTAGGSVNYLPAPQWLLGASWQQAGRDSAQALSADWEAGGWLRLSGRWYRTLQAGQGLNAQLGSQLGETQLDLAFNRGWGGAQRAADSAALTLQRPLWQGGWGSVRVQRDEGLAGVGVNLGLGSSQELFGSRGYLQLSLFERPVSGGTRSRGMELSMQWNLESGPRSYSGSVGGFSDGQGQSTRYLGAGVRQQWEQGPLRQLSLDARADGKGVGLQANGQLEHRLARGNVYLNRGSNRELSAALNLNSTLALGGGQVGLSGEEFHEAAGMIIDVESDLPDATLEVDGTRWGRSRLRPGRNVLPLPAYRPGVLHLSVKEDEGTLARVQPASLSYRLNRGGVGHQRVRVMQTLAVMGRVVDAAGQPLAGAVVVNHAGRTLSDLAGVFVLDVHARTPQLRVEKNGEVLCELHFRPDEHSRDGEMLMVGDMRCEQKAAAGRVEGVS